MESIGKNLTASSILSQGLNARQAGPLPEKEQNQESAINTQDVMEKSTAKQDADFKKKAALLPLSERGKQSIGLAAAIGGVVGGVGGGLYGKSLADRRIITSAKLNEVELTWKEPVMKADTLGSIPSNFHTINFIDRDSLQSASNVAENMVIVDNPVLNGDGSVQMREVTAKWQDFGEPRVTITPEKIEHTMYAGYKEEIRPVTVKTTNISGSGNADVSTGAGVKAGATQDEKLVGYNHDHTPVFNKTTLGYYEKPSVEFDKGVNVIGYTIIGGFIGVVLGATTGGLAGAVIEKVRLINEASQAVYQKPKPKPTSVEE